MNTKQSSTKTKTVHALKSPYTAPSWHVLSTHLENEILDALVPLLEPIGRYRRRTGSKSRGTRRKRRKLKNDGQTEDESHAIPKDNAVQALASEPDIQNYLTIGFNSTVQRLQVLIHGGQSEMLQKSNEKHPLTVPFTIFVCTSILPSIMTAQLPHLVANLLPHLEVVDLPRLVSISPAASSKISDALDQPRANILGILPGIGCLEPLQTLIRNKVEPTDITWISEVKSGKYRPVKFHSEERPVVNPKKNLGTGMVGENP